jgi:hypothetical protein
MKTHALILLIFGSCLCLHAADPATAAKTLGGEFDATTGAVVVKKNKTPDVAALSELASAPCVKSIMLDGCSLKSDGVAALGQSKALTALRMEHTLVNKVPDLKVLAGITTLEELNLGGSDFGDEGLATLCRLTNLRTLHLGHVGRSDKTAFTAEGLKALTKLPKLESLILHFQKPDDAMISVLASLRTVKDFKVGGVASEYLNRLQAAMPQAKVASRGPTTDAKKP